MEKLVTVADVKERYGCSRQTARKYIRQCNPHMEKPLATPEWAFREWEASRVEAVDYKQYVMNMERMVMANNGARVIVPRRR